MWPEEGALIKNSVMEVASEVPPGLIPNGEQGQEGSSHICFLVEQCTVVYILHFLLLFFSIFVCGAHTIGHMWKSVLSFSHVGLRD